MPATISNIQRITSDTFTYAVPNISGAFVNVIYSENASTVPYATLDGSAMATILATSGRICAFSRFVDSGIIGTTVNVSVNPLARGFIFTVSGANISAPYRIPASDSTIEIGPAETWSTGTVDDCRTGHLIIGMTSYQSGFLNAVPLFGAVTQDAFVDENNRSNYLFTRAGQNGDVGTAYQYFLPEPEEVFPSFIKSYAYAARGFTTSREYYYT